MLSICAIGISHLHLLCFCRILYYLGTYKEYLSKCITEENLQCCSQSQLYMMINYIITEDNLFKQCSVLNCFLFPFSFFVSLFLPLIITHRHTVLPVRADSLYMMQLNTQAYKNNWRSVIMLLVLY